MSVDVSIVIAITTLSQIVLCPFVLISNSFDSLTKSNALPRPREDGEGDRCDAKRDAKTTK